MGLLRAGAGAIGGVLADQWKEFFYCDSIDKEVLVVKGQKKIGNRSSNTKGSDNVISNGSGVVVADGQCMIIVEQGKIVDVCAEPGEFIYKTDIEPSVFTGKLGDSIKKTFSQIGKRFTYGGDTGKDQRVYYFNTKEILDNKFGTPNPVMFRVVDERIGFDMDVSLRCSGIYTYRIIDPILFYTNVCGNVSGVYRRDEIDSTLKTEFISALQPALAKLSEMGLRPNQVVAHTTELENAMNEALSASWGSTRGLNVEKVSLGSVTIPDEDAEMLKRVQRAAVNLNPMMGIATTLDAKQEAMRTAAGNNAGAMAGFMGMGLGMNAGSSDIQALYGMASQNQNMNNGMQQNPVSGDAWKCSCGATVTGNFCPQCGAKKPAPAQGWKCSCGAVANGNFCPQCGAQKPADNSWKCSCGAVNTGNFCANCGAKKQESKPSFKCDKCGWVPEDPSNPPKFCPECGDIFDSSDIN